MKKNCTFFKVKMIYYNMYKKTIGLLNQLFVYIFQGQKGHSTRNCPFDPGARFKGQRHTGASQQRILTIGYYKFTTNLLFLLRHCGNWTQSLSTTNQFGGTRFVRKCNERSTQWSLETYKGLDEVESFGKSNQIDQVLSRKKKVEWTPIRDAASLWSL